MGNLIYPTLPGRSLPTGRAVLPPRVHVRTTPSEREYRSRDALLPRYQYSVSYEWLRSRASSPELQALVGFYAKVGGGFDSFLYLDPDDNTVSAGLLGTGDGTTTSFQLLRSFGGFAEPVSAVVGVPVITMTGGKGGLGSFEVDTNGDNLSDGVALFVGGSGDAGRTHTLSRVPTVAAAHGSASQFLQISGGVANGNDSGILLTASVPVMPGVQYKLSGCVATNVASKVYLLARIYDQFGATLSDQVTGFVPVGGRFTTTNTFTAPVGAANVSLNVRGITLAGEYIDVDALQLSPTQLAADAAPSSISLLPGPDYSLDPMSGRITFTRPPAAGAALTWSGQFYRRCRFLGDKLDTDKFLAGLFSARRVEFISTKA